MGTGFSRRGVTLLAAVTAFALTGCNFHATTSTGEPELNQEADRLFKDILAGDAEAATARMSSENRVEQIRAQVPVIRNLVGDETPPAPTVVGSQKTVSTDGSFYGVTQRYAYSDRTVHLATNFKTEGKDWKILRFNVNVEMIAPPALAAPAADPAAPKV